MVALFSYRWIDAEGEFSIDSDKVKLWAEETKHLTDDQWRNGIEVVKDKVKACGAKGVDPWPPSYIEFVGMCEGSTSLDKDLAYTELMKYLMLPENRRKSKDLSPLVYHTYTQNIDGYAFKQMRGDEARRAFNVAFKATLAQIELGQTLCVPTEQEALPKPVVTQKAKKIGEKTIDSLRAMF